MINWWSFLAGVVAAFLFIFAVIFGVMLRESRPWRK